MARWLTFQLSTAEVCSSIAVAAPLKKWPNLPFKPPNRDWNHRRSRQNHEFKLIASLKRYPLGQGHILRVIHSVCLAAHVQFPGIRP